MNTLEDRGAARIDEHLGSENAPRAASSRSQRLVAWYVGSLLVGLILLGSFYNVIQQAVLRAQQQGPLTAQAGKADGCASARTRDACDGIDASTNTKGVAAQLMANGR